MEINDVVGAGKQSSVTRILASCVFLDLATKLDWDPGKRGLDWQSSSLKWGGNWKCTAVNLKWIQQLVWLVCNL